MSLKYSFYEVLTGVLNVSIPASERARLKQLRQHCLEPGRYHKYISRWLRVFGQSRMLFVDGGMLNVQPSHVLSSVQKFLKLPVLDYGNILR